jgi:hypothetical protein
LDEDLAQADTPRLFDNDLTGTDIFGIPKGAGYWFCYKAKFQNWVEVNVGGAWYVCSPYTNWQVRLSAVYDENAGVYIWKPNAPHQIVTGHTGLDSFAGSWQPD